MKTNLPILFFLICSSAFAQLLAPGDIAFTALNADGDDDFAIVTFKDIPANSAVYFSDNEWDGMALNTGEANWEWQTGSAIIPAGTVISFNSISSASRTVSIGSYVGTPGGLSASSEAIFCYLGTDVNTPTVFLAAVANSSSAYQSLMGTGLSENLTAITYPSGTDIGAYKGVRTGLGVGGYLAALNTPANYDYQDASGDQHMDGIVPDLPFDTTTFTISSTDVTPPSVTTVTVINPTVLQVVFSEDVTSATATAVANYTISNAINISGINYDAATRTATITHMGLVTGVGYTLTVNNITDLNMNTQTQPFVSGLFYYNNLNTGLIITEIMYNAPGSMNGNDLEFVELYNNTTASIAVGGLVFSDTNSINYTLPEQNVPAQGVLLLATNKTVADAFYGVSFLDLGAPQTNNFGNGGEQLTITNSLGATVTTVTYDDAAPWPLSPDGSGPSLELLNPAGVLNDGANWRPATNLVGTNEGINILASPGTFMPVVATMPSVSFSQPFRNVSENAGAINIPVTISAAPTSDVTLTITPAMGATAGTGITLNTATLTFTATGALTQNVSVTINDNTVANDDVFGAYTLTNITGAVAGTNGTTVVYILDDELHAPTAQNLLNMQYASSFAIPGSDAGSEIVAHDPASQRLFVMNNAAGSIEILDFSNPLAITYINRVNLDSQTIGAAAGDVIIGTSVASHNGIIAATSVRVEDAAGNALFAPGTVTFMNTSGAFLASVAVGNLPDMITFTPDGTKLLVANEGQPSEDYLTDPEGSVSIIDLTGGIASLTQAQVTTLNFNAFDSQLNTLRAAGVRVYGPGATVSQDLEPEYITVAANSQTAWVVMQENNAIAQINLTTNTITNLWSLGLKDHSIPGNGLDVNDDTNFINMATWPIHGIYMPDGIATYNVNGTDYIVTANEGDARDYAAYSDEVTINDPSYVLDPVAFPNQNLLKRAGNLDQIKISNAAGDLDGDGDYDQIQVYGSRSFSIFNASTGALVYDSADDFERIVKENSVYGSIFNASNSNNNFKNRSDDKGPEPEGVIVQQIGTKTYAFIGLERVGGLMVYDITNPMAPVFETYVNNRGTVAGANETGDLGPEGLIYIAPNNNSLGKGLVVVANEVSATLSVYSVDNDVLSTSEVSTLPGLVLYPNPVKRGNPLFLNQPTAFTVYDLTGRKVARAVESAWLDTTDLTTGIYLIKTETQTIKFIVD